MRSWSEGMLWLDVPPLKQAELGWCLPACVAMVAAYLEQPLLQDDVARWLGTQEAGTPAGRIRRMAQRGFEVTYKTGSIAEMEDWLKRQVPPILFVRTGELSHWSVDTPHAVVLAGLTAGEAYIFDPGVDLAPVSVLPEELWLAWSHFDYSYATLTLSK